MEEVEYYEVKRWVWDCFNPDCGAWNEEEDDPAYQEIIVCEGCGAEYKPING